MAVNMNALQILLFMNLSHVMRTYCRCENSCESFIEVKDSQVFVKSVKNLYEFFICVTNIRIMSEFFTVVTDSFNFHIQTNL